MTQSLTPSDAENRTLSPTFPLTSSAPLPDALPAPRGPVGSAILPAPDMPAAREGGGLGYDDIVRDLTRVLSVTTGPVPFTAPGDTITVLWDGKTVAQGVVSNDSSGQNRFYTIDIPVYRLSTYDEGEYRLSYVVDYLASEGRDSSLDTFVQLKTEVPGGLDPRPDTPYLNENLAQPLISPEGEIKSPDGVTVTVPLWTNKYSDDRLTVIWGGSRWRR